ncbi:MAG TPA: tetratricopeptide repeat protein, partial [Thermoanaerobaculia bacterium]|nr:tetratricopeptide repeat protein [Thermoanaerobaculia bacterium]
YTRLNEETNIVSALSTLAEACLAERNYEQAAKALERLIEREPQNAQHRTKLQFVMQQMGVKAPISTRPQTPPQPAAPPPPRPDISLAMELEEPVPTFDIEEPTEPAIAIDFDPSPPIELDFGAVAEPPPIPAPVVPEAEIPSAVEEEEDLDFVTEHLTEAEVFAKYGLAEKAAEHLRAVLERSPRNVTAHERLYRLLLDEGAFADARAAALNFINVLREKGDTDAIDAVHNEFLSRGQSLEAAPAKPARPATQEVPRPKTVERPKPKTVEKPAPPPPVVEPDSLLATEIAASEEISIDLDSGGVNFDVDAINLDTAMAGGDEAQAVVPGPEIEAVASEPAFDFGAPAEEPPLFAEEPAAVADEPSFEQLGEIDFYIEQELYDEARRKVEVLLVSYPDHPSLLERLERLEQAAAASAAPPPPPAPSRPPTLSRDEIESELLAAIPEDDEMTIPAPPPQAVEPPAAPVAAIAPEHEESLFADEDNFFDLASELESELAEDLEPVPLAEEEQSLEQIFKEFKKGVEQQLDSEDYDTHYNLGIAYKEMGLIDEAIGEFQLASKDPKRAVECASMLGLCFLEKGMPQLAIKWYRKGLEIPELTEEEHIGLLYDLGSAYVEVGDTANAQKAFLEVYGMNTNYRDVVSRIKQLEAAR